MGGAGGGCHAGIASAAFGYYGLHVVGASSRGGATTWLRVIIGTSDVIRGLDGYFHYGGCHFLTGALLHAILHGLILLEFVPSLAAAAATVAGALFMMLLRFVFGFFLLLLLPFLVGFGEGLEELFPFAALA